MAVTILVTGFGPFPGAPFNPTGPLVKQLARCAGRLWRMSKFFPYFSRPATRRWTATCPR